MNICVLGNSPVPFVRGGMEIMLTALTDAINLHTSHKAELLKIPCNENEFWHFIDLHQKFYRLDLSHFDRVISIKSPTWLAKHPEHFIYMGHTFRASYDLWRPRPPIPRFGRGVSQVARVYAAIESPALDEDDGIQRLFDALSELRLIASQFPVAAFSIYGEFFRDVIRYLDRMAMAPNRIRDYFCISRTVAERENYFPPGIVARVLHHPPSFKASNLAPKFDYFFTASRLEATKRMKLVVQAMRYVRGNIPLLIAGDGSEETALRELAQGDSRIKILGQISQADLQDLYVGALAVPFVPFQEDYGLITVEAMQAGKPVITARDSGGPTEFVEDGLTGFCVAPNAESLAEKMQYFVDRPNRAREMGALAAKKVSSITWERVAENLTGEPRSAGARNNRVKSSRAKLVVTSPFPVYPPCGGGQNRIFYLYRALARLWDIEIVSLVPYGLPASRREIAPGLTESQVPMSALDAKMLGDLQVSAGGTYAIDDIYMSFGLKHTADFELALSSAFSGASIAILSHPYLLGSLQKARGGIPLFYEAHNVEADLKSDFLRGNLVGENLIRHVNEVESEACHISQKIVTTIEEDSQRLSLLYGISVEKMKVIPNGVDLNQFATPKPTVRYLNKLRLGVEGRRIVSFVGSAHPPNHAAAQQLMRFAEQLPGTYFLLIGGVCAYLSETKLPLNVALMGMMEDGQKNFLLRCSDLAINPMEKGSGTNLKNWESFAAGLPVLATPQGARGVPGKSGEYIFVSELEDFPERIGALHHFELEQVAQRARQLVETHYDWRILAFGYGAILKEFL